MRGFRRRRPSSTGRWAQMVALKAWYCDSTHRYPMTDAVQPLMVTSRHARKPAENPKADLDRYYMLAHGSHLVDTARFFAGEIVAVDARLLNRAGIRCWFVDVEFANGTLGHLDLTVAVRMDWHEGLPDLWREWLHPWEDLQPVVLQVVRGGHLPRGRRRDPPRAGGGRAFLPPSAGGLCRDDPDRRAAVRGGSGGWHCLGPRDGGHRAVGPRPADRCGWPMCRGGSDAARDLRQDLCRGRSADRAAGRRGRGLSLRAVQHGLLRPVRRCPTPDRGRRPPPWRRPAPRLAWRLPPSLAPTT